MIEKQEILHFAKIQNLDPSIIEKDYVLGWILMAVQQHPLLSNAWIFKGGTCLKKCYFEDYRFSEDLDFTVRSAEIYTDALKKWLVEASDWVYESSGIEIPTRQISVEQYKNPRQESSFQCRLCFLGPLRRKTNFPRVKLDLTVDEKIVLKPEQRDIFHPYSDKPSEKIKACCYPFEEVFAEKIRALAERARPRDLYDVIHLYRASKSVNKDTLLEILRQKCHFKNISFPHLDAIHNHPQKSILQSEWEHMLGHQLEHLEPFDSFWEELPKFFSWLGNSAEAAK